jgi:hypothetical protein
VGVTVAQGTAPNRRVMPWALARVVSCHPEATTRVLRDRMADVSAWGRPRAVCGVHTQPQRTGTVASRAAAAERIEGRPLRTVK